MLHTQSLERKEIGTSFACFRMVKISILTCILCDYTPYYQRASEIVHRASFTVEIERLTRRGLVCSGELLARLLKSPAGTSVIHAGLSDRFLDRSNLVHLFLSFMGLQLLRFRPNIKIGLLVPTCDNVVRGL